MNITPKLLDKIGRVAHEAVRAWCRANDMPLQASWDALDRQTKDACLRGVRLHLTTPQAGAAASHEAWITHMMGLGWTHGERDFVNKKSPNLVPFSELPLHEQVKDHIFKGVVDVVGRVLCSN